MLLCIHGCENLDVGITIVARISTCNLLAIGHDLIRSDRFSSPLEVAWVPLALRELVSSKSFMVGGKPLNF
jgi:hypothetical protein